jgi:drug/metabolite transporter (DMT)-like permease
MLSSWFLLALLTALVHGLHSVYVKAYGESVNQYLVVWGTFAFSVPVFAAALWMNGLPAVGEDFWWAASLSVGANLVAWPLFVRSVQISELSLVMPLLSFTPVFILGVEYVLLGATPGAYGLAGILAIVFGAYVLNIQPDKSGPLEPLKSLASDRGAVFMCAVAAIWSLSATAEKITVTSSSPVFYLTVLTGALTCLFWPFVQVKLENPISEVRRTTPVLMGLGGLFALMAILQMSAIELTPLVNYVIAIKRSGMLVSVVFGWLLFSEKNILFRSAGAGMMVVGVILIRVV